MQDQVARLVKAGCDLSLRQLHVLFQCHARGALTVKELSESGGDNLDRPAVSRAVERIRELGYVDRREHPDDRRSVLVSLTAPGKAFVKGALRTT